MKVSRKARELQVVISDKTFGLLMSKQLHLINFNIFEEFSDSISTKDNSHQKDQLPANGFTTLRE